MSHTNIILGTEPNDSDDFLVELQTEDHDSHVVQHPNCFFTFEGAVTVVADVALATEQEEAIYLV